MQNYFVRMIRLPKIPKSHHFECDYTLISLSPAIQSNEKTELKQPVSFKLEKTKKNPIKSNFFKTGSSSKS